MTIFPGSADRDAFERLLGPQLPKLYRLAYRLAGTVADAEDLLQDVLDGALLCQFSLFRHISLWGEVRYRDIQSTDPRITYDRIRGALGIKWAL